MVCMASQATPWSVWPHKPRHGLCMASPATPWSVWPRQPWSVLVSTHRAGPESSLWPRRRPRPSPQQRPRPRPTNSAPGRGPATTAAGPGKIPTDGMIAAQLQKAGDRPAVDYMNDQTLWPHLDVKDTASARVMRLRKVGFEPATLRLPALHHGPLHYDGPCTGAQSRAWPRSPSHA
jgi:hypothetical protein